jgi:intracellular sulfur oxidation DsrE/DsrF family protein
MPNDSSRRDFLTTLAATAAGASLGAYARPLAAAPVDAPTTFDDSWTQKVAAAKHRAVFDSPEVSEGLAVGQAWLHREGYAAAIGAAPGDVASVVVFRHAGIVLAFDDALWEKYGIGEWKEIQDPATQKPAKRNPWARPGAGIDAGESVQELRERGGIVLACNLAMNRRAEQLAARAHADVEAVRAEVRAHLLPGVILQPSGVYAVARAQEVGCVFMRST